MSRFNVVTILKKSALSRRSSGLETENIFFHDMHGIVTPGVFGPSVLISDLV